MNVRFTRRASLDLQTILSGLEDKNPHAAMRLSQQLEEVVTRLSSFPSSYQRVEPRPSVRRVPLPRYPYLVFYRVMAGEVEVLRIIHGARRDPWEDL